MPRTHRARLAAAVVALLVPAVAPASGTHTLTIGTTILGVGNCRFQAPGPTLLDFGTIDPSSATNATASVNIQFRCTGGGANPTIIWYVASDWGQHETGPGAPRMRHTGDPSKYLAYSLNLPASGTTSKNTVTNLTVNGTIQVADFANAVAGTYTDSVVLTISP